MPEGVVYRGLCRKPVNGLPAVTRLGGERLRSILAHHETNAYNTSERMVHVFVAIQRLNHEAQVSHTYVRQTLPGFSVLDLRSHWTDLLFVWLQSVFYFCGCRRSPHIAFFECVGNPTPP